MTVTELKTLLERVEKMGHGDARVFHLKLNGLFTSYTEVEGATLNDTGGNLLDEEYHQTYQVTLS